VFLKNQNAICPRFGNGFLVYKDAARSNLMKAGNQMEQGRLAATRRANDAEKLTFPNVEVDAVESKQALVSLRLVAQGYVFESKLGDVGGRGAQWQNVRDIFVASTAARR